MFKTKIMYSNHCISNIKYICLYRKYTVFGFIIIYIKRNGFNNLLCLPSLSQNLVTVVFNLWKKKHLKVSNDTSLLPDCVIIKLLLNIPANEEIKKKKG